MKYNLAVKVYIKNQLKALQTLYPELSKDELLEVIMEDIKENFVDPKVTIFNNYKNTRKTDWTLNQFLIWFFQKKPITTEHGVMFKPHNEAPNHPGDMVTEFLDQRKVEKKLMFKAKEEGNKALAEVHNMNQKVWKILANSAYGVFGQVSSAFYNLHVALSVTGKGQSIISTAMTTFENFLAGSIKLKNIDELLVFVNNIKEETAEKPLFLMKDITDTQLKNRLRSYCVDGIMNLDFALDKIIDSCTQEEKNKIYYKNNFYAFLKQESVLNLINDIIEKAEVFRNAAEPPKEVEEDLKFLWEIVSYYVVYNHVKFDKINILKTNEREAVLGVNVLAPVKLF